MQVCGVHPLTVLLTAPMLLRCVRILCVYCMVAVDPVRGASMCTPRGVLSRSVQWCIVPLESLRPSLPPLAPLPGTPSASPYIGPCAAQTLLAILCPYPRGPCRRLPLAPIVCIGPP